MAVERTFVWCTYRTWSFRVLEGVLDVPSWHSALVVTTPDCVYDFERLRSRGIQVLRADPKDAVDSILACRPAAGFFYGWSWYVPQVLRDAFPCVTLHPGRLPQGRGGSPLQNQMRDGDEWTDANLIRLEKDLDAGPIYDKARISLVGTIDDVWARMTATGTALTRTFLRRLAEGTAVATPQPAGTPATRRRVQPGAEQLDPAHQTARQMGDIVRAHSETDPNTYVRPAWLAGTHARWVIQRAALAVPADVTAVTFDEAQDADACHALCRDVNEGSHVLRIEGADGRALFATRCYVASP